MSEIQSQPAVPGSESYYLATPESGKGRPVLVLHAWWGLNPFFKQFCDRLAREGFVVLAPDLFQGAVATTIAEAERISSRFEVDRAAQEQLARRIKQAAALLQTIGGPFAPSAVRAVHGTKDGPNAREIGVVAFSFGGWWTVWLANQKDNPVAAAVLFYATGGGDFANSHAAYQFHRAENDTYEPPANFEQVRQSLRAAGKQAEFYTYPGTTHWFFESDRPDAYNAEAANLAWQRTVEFLKAHVPLPSA